MASRDDTKTISGRRGWRLQIPRIQTRDCDRMWLGDIIQTCRKHGWLGTLTNLVGATCEANVPVDPDSESQRWAMMHRWDGFEKR